MQKLLALLCCIATVAVVFIGEWYWNSSVTKPVQANGKEENTSYMEPTKESHDFISSLPTELVEKAEKAVENGTKLTFVIYGSEATSTDDNGWPKRFEKELKNTYDNLFDVIIYSNEGKTSRDVVNEELYQKVIDHSPDILLFEPFVLKDNGGGVGDTLENLTTILEEIKVEHPNVTIYLQPPHPIFTAVNYPIQVENLKEYALENGYHFLDHWEAWTEQDDDLYLEEGKGEPNEAGHQVWAQFLISYFIQE